METDGVENLRAVLLRKPLNRGGGERGRQVRGFRDSFNPGRKSRCSSAGGRTHGSREERGEGAGDADGVGLKDESVGGVGGESRRTGWTAEG